MNYRTLPRGYRHVEYMDFVRNRRQLLTAQHIAEGKARAYRGQLIRVAHQNQTAVLRQSLHEAVQQRDVHHGHLIHDHSISLQRILCIPGEEKITGAGVNPCLQ